MIIQKKTENISKITNQNINRVFNIFTFLPFVAKPADQRTKYLQNRCSFMRGICTQKIGAIARLGAEKITFPHKPDGHTDIQSDRQTDGHLLL